MSRFSRLTAMAMVLFLAFGSMLFMAFIIEEAGRRGFEFVIAGLFGLAGMGFLLLQGPVGKALAAMLEGSSLDGVSAQRIAELESRLADIEHRGLTSGEVEQAYARIAEVEERMEFTERLLAQPRIGEGRHGA
jgi:tetrahydromethanopterin S-methyltransferase subunit G